MDAIVETIEPGPSDLTDLTTTLVAAYVSNNRVPVSDLPALIASMHAALTGLGAPAAPATPTVEKPTPSRIRKSVTQDVLISFEDGKPYKTLKRHLTALGISPEAYREKWGLPRDYPMTSASYSEMRAGFARSIGLGHGRRKAEPRPAAEPAETAAEKPKRAVGRPRKAKGAVGA